MARALADVEAADGQRFAALGGHRDAFLQALAALAAAHVTTRNGTSPRTSLLSARGGTLGGEAQMRVPARKQVCDRVGRRSVVG